MDIIAAIVADLNWVWKCFTTSHFETKELNKGIIIDCSRYFNKIIKLNLKEEWIEVEPGIILKKLNDILKPHGYHFAPHISPDDRATIGGMISTDACGKGSYVFGKTSDNLISASTILSDGSDYDFNKEFAINSDKGSKLVEILTGKEQLIKEKFPESIRFASGYNLNKLLSENNAFKSAIFTIRKLGNKAPKNLSQVTICPSSIGNTLVSNKNIALISATGSCAMGHKVGVEVAKRFGKSLLELGGNNAVIVTPTADLNIALPSIIFGSVGTAGQRCTSTRRVFAYKSIYEDIFNKLKSSYNSLNSKIGNPLETNTLIGPLIDKKAYQTMQESLKIAKKDAEEIIGGQAMLTDKYPNAAYVSPALVKLKKQVEIVYQETFAPILYVMPYDNLEEAIAMHNDVSQGLSSAIFTNNLREAEIFKQYSDCGIANVNIGTSGAEIGGAFGGEKETGGGRESGSDAWKSYMRRQTSTTYYGNSTPALAQNIKFEF